METKQDTIMLIDDNIANLKSGKNALSENYNVFAALSAEKMFELLESEPELPELLLLDVDMPGMSGYDAIEQLKLNPRTKKIPVIFLTGKSDSDSEIKGLTLGAVDYISKPFLPELLRIRVGLHLTVERQKRLLEKQGAELKMFNDNLQGVIEQKTKNVTQLQNAILQTVADLVESRDGDTGNHVERTQRWLELMINALEELGLYSNETSGWDKELVLQSSQLHDVGKISIPDYILQKPEKLTDLEFEEMKNHTTYGAKIIEKMAENMDNDVFLNYAKIMAETHQEKWDGSGYPRGLAGEKIPLLGRLMAIADVYDALTSARPYKEAYSHEKAVELIAEGRGTHFDPTLVDIFLSVEEEIKAEKET
ncbi:MAG: response regulator [Oscillospiraceae bacterium]|jgi:putative two-component system response regulator|nr:response regulator [Oscillospiraceae bacterium]